MKILISELRGLFKNNLEVVLLIFLIILAGISTQIYNINKKETGHNYLKLINNTYFQQTLNHVFENLEPKFNNIEHIVKPGENYEKILNIYSVPQGEIKKLMSALLKQKSFTNLKANQIVNLTLDKSKNNEITKVIFPASKTIKVILTKNNIA